MAKENDLCPDCGHDPKYGHWSGCKLYGDMACFMRDFATITCANCGASVDTGQTKVCGDCGIEIKVR